MAESEPQLEPLFWIGPTLRTLVLFRRQDEFGFAFFQAQLGAKHIAAKPMKGFGGAGILEVVADHDGNTYRAVYTVRFEGAAYVLHTFQKKSKHGIATPKHEIRLIQQRLREAAAQHAQWRRQQHRSE